MEKLVATYMLYVYASGKVELKPIVTQTGQINTKGASNSIRQIMKVLEHVARSGNNSGIRRKVSEGIDAVAESEGINISSVHVKVSRKLGLTMKEFKDQVETYFKDGTGDLEKTLCNACVAKTKAEDNAAIEQVIKLINEKR